MPPARTSSVDAPIASAASPAPVASTSPVGAPIDAPGEARRKPSWHQRLHGAGPILGLVLLCIAGTALNPDFATWDNAMNVLTRTAFIGIIAIGMCFVIIAGGIDLSVGSMAALIAGSMILVMNALAAHVAPRVLVV